MKRFFNRALRVVLFRLIAFGLVLAALVVLPPLSIISRLFRRRFKVGIGPLPLINNIHHKKALASAGYSAETFVNQVYYITNEFDFAPRIRSHQVKGLLLFVRAIFRYECLYIYFNGGPLSWARLGWMEPLLYRLAGLKVVVMPYGGDIYDSLRCPNLSYRAATLVDYPVFQKTTRSRIRRNVDRWSRSADHVISGCDWVDYMWHWDTLLPAHFSIDLARLDRFKPVRRPDQDPELLVLHAPNHRAIKGTRAIIEAVERLRARGVAIRLELIQKMPNEQLMQKVADADLIVDQLVIGWHGIFALEAMAISKPVVCFLRPDLKHLYTASSGLIDEKDMPLISADEATIEGVLEDLVRRKSELPAIGAKSRAYVEKYHSTQVIGQVFRRINQSMGVLPDLK
jgi:glycosyltransferase involved in cell wall biosynthesis